MQCPRCQKEMLNLEDFGFEMCHTDGCPISKYEQDGDFYVYSLSFTKYPNIYIETGRNRSGYFTYISQIGSEELHLEEKVIQSFNKEMLDMTPEKLQLILTFG